MEAWSLLFERVLKRLAEEEEEEENGEAVLGSDSNWEKEAVEGCAVIKVELSMVRAKAREALALFSNLRLVDSFRFLQPK